MIQTNKKKGRADASNVFYITNNEKIQLQEIVQF